AALRAGNAGAARGHLDVAAAEFTRLGDVVAVAAALSQRADLEAEAGRLTTADSLFRLAGARIAGRSVPDVSWRIHAGQADLHARRGRTADAARELRLSIRAIEQIGSSLRLAERRSATLADKWTVYQRLALIERNRGRVAESFAASEALRAREMVELLAMGRVDAPRDTAADLVAKEQDLRRRIGELSRTVQTTSPDWQFIRGPDVGQVDATTRQALLAAQATYADLQLEIRERAPRHAALIAGVPPVSWRSIANALNQNEVMLEYLLTDSASVVYVITRDTLAAIQLPVAHRALARRVSFALGALTPRGGGADSAWRAPMRQLHRELISPVHATGLLEGKTRLVIVPHAELHYLPFAALIDEGTSPTFLVQRYVVSVAPSASVWVGARGAKPRRGTGILAMGPRLEQLPGSRQEIVAITRRGGATARVLTGSAASETAFRREAPTRRVIHLATYGVLNKQNPLFSFVDLAEDGVNDGRLDVHEVFGLRLVADLVVLSACQTALASGALGDVPAGDDWVGLSWAFLSAGARSVVASLWPVQDQATATLMVQFYTRYDPGADPRDALAWAQRAMLAVPSTAHPYYWAGFEAIGGR
ncbi:MAG: CHAT domain-containing protein, partial [Gemmatimonadales bacterium]|nr:CHAT domain-containing protein [Gemmatimonadales bacterium]